ncbi:MAG: phosphate regulon sensor histidine kinase PhoR [Proteobacteria bacterium]|nr:phosphate regulon sensor histidine kinase PhoR [Pseudomonadota bacterium]
MNPVWGSTVGLALVAALVGALLWALAGPVWGLAAVGIVLGARVLYHAHHLAALYRWLRDPQTRALPQGEGVWEDALADLHRVLKQRDTAQADLRHTLTRFRAAGQALPDGVVILDGEYRIEWANATAARHLGIDTRRDAGQPIVNLVRQPDFVAYMKRAEFGTPLALRSLRNDAALLLRVIAFGDDRMLLNSRDITGEERLDAMRRDFVANVSHELKTPITVLAGFVETLSDGANALTEAQRSRFLALMSEQAGRMQRLIEDLLTLSALESAPAPRDERPIDMRAFVERLGEEARALSGGRHAISVSVGEDAQLLADPQELASACSNLVSNAVRYTPEGGSVRIDWQLADGHGRFSVTDSGIGVDPRHLPRLTERFYRVDQGRSRESGGTGLGLAIVKHVLTRHQAQLEIESASGRGSTFSAMFPAERISTAPASGTRPPPALRAVG